MEGWGSGEGAWHEPMRGMRRGQLVKEVGRKGEDYRRKEEGTRVQEEGTRVQAEGTGGGDKGTGRGDEGTRGMRLGSPTLILQACK